MENLNIDSGIREFQCNGAGVLRFNPSDPNLFGRFLAAAEEIEAVENELLGAESGDDVIRIMTRADEKMKEILSKVFDADIHALLSGVSLLAVGANGKRVITNLFDALLPVLREGAERCAQSRAEAVLQEVP